MTPRVVFHQTQCRAAPRTTFAIYGVLVFVSLLVLSGPTQAQNSSLYQQDMPAPPEDQATTLANSSWTFRQLEAPHEIKIHDIISIRVDEKAQVLSGGEVERRKNGLYDAYLKDWVHLVGLKALKPDEQADGDQRIQGQLNQLYRTEAELETMESMKFEIAAEVADIRPNGNLVLEAHRVIRVNDETWEYSLSGICSADDVGPGLVVLSRDIAELSIKKRERGHVRDGYRRGWFTRWFDVLQPF
jgi:flagellar L-ring protein precursor FlgH